MNPKATTTVAVLAMFLLASAPASQPSTRPDGTFSSVQAIFDTLPPGLLPEDDSGWTSLKIEEINRDLEKTAKGKPFDLVFTVSDIRQGDRVDGYLLVGWCMARKRQVAVGIALPRTDRTREVLSTVDANSSVSARGKVVRAQIIKTGGENEIQFLVVGAATDVKPQPKARN